MAFTEKDVGPRRTSTGVIEWSLEERIAIAKEWNAAVAVREAEELKDTPSLEERLTAIEDAIDNNDPTAVRAIKTRLGR